MNHDHSPTTDLLRAHLAKMPADAREIVSARLISAPREAVFAAFADPRCLARWWGPNGFTNTFDEFDLRPGGKWHFTMHAPDGAAFRNESLFVTVEPGARIVFDHLEPVHGFRMTMLFAGQDGKTCLIWRMLFDDVSECDRVKRFIVAANEQNFDRLEAQLAHSA